MKKVDEQEDIPADHERREITKVTPLEGEEVKKTRRQGCNVFAVDDDNLVASRILFFSSDNNHAKPFFVSKTGHHE